MKRPPSRKRLKRTRGLRPGGKPLGRGASLSRKSELVRKTRMKRSNRRRKAREFKRAYGSVERVEAVKSRGCCVPGCSPALARDGFEYWARSTIDNMHTRGGGTGRKSDAKHNANGCRWHHRFAPDSLHNLGSVERFNEVHGIDLHEVAASISTELDKVVAE